jgi:hypothetical protein
MKLVFALHFVNSKSIRYNFKENCVQLKIAFELKFKISDRFNKMKIIVFTILLVFYSFDLILSEDLKCGRNSDKTADELFARIIILSNYSSNFPDNNEKMSPYCK